MRWMTDLWFRLRALFARDGMERDLQEEFAFHVEMEARKLEAAGIKGAEIFVFDGSDLAPSAVGGDAMFTALQRFIEDPDDITGVLEFIEAAADGAY